MKKILAITLLSFIGPFSVQASCNKLIELKTIDQNVYQCKDGTISYSQSTLYGSEAKDKKNDYEGMCGPTAAANVFHAYCKNFFVEPKDIATKYFDDVTPGVRPDTLEYGLNKLFDNNDECIPGSWTYYYSKNRWSFLNSLVHELQNEETYWTRTRKDGSKVKRAPVPVLISKKSSGKVLHWVTVVDIIGYSDNDLEDYRKEECKVIYNDLGDQHTKSCEDFVTYAHQVDNHTLLGWMPEYIHVVFEASAFYKLAKRAKTFERELGREVVNKAMEKMKLGSGAVIKDIDSRE